MASRYFRESSDSQDAIKPGQISNRLRRAIGLHDDKLPIWIYRMRALGYPPGWLKKAKVSSLNIFDDKDAENSSGKRKADDEPAPSHDATYDPEKFIVYPGFNAPVPPGFVDCHYELGMPPMLPHQQLDYARMHIKIPEPIRPLKRRRGNHQEEEEEVAGEEEEGEEEEGEEGELREDEEEIEERERETEGETDEEDEEEEKIEEREHLKVEKRNDLKGGEEVLEEGKEVKERKVVEKEVQEGEQEEEKESEGEKEKEEEEGGEISDDEVTEVKEVIHSPQLKRVDSQLKIISTGSPLPKSASKPSLDKFSEGMSDLLYFQNLPDSTGMFERMRNVLKKVRKSLVRR